VSTDSDYTENPTMKLRIYTPEDLQFIVTEGSSGFASQAAWVVTFAKNAAALLKLQTTGEIDGGGFPWSKLLGDARR
jgi:hypothetical protein